MKTNKGFTLIELLIVIAIIGILAVALLPSVLSAPASARDAGKKAALNSIAVALEQYNATTGSYPADGACLTNSSPAGILIKSYFKDGNVPTLTTAPTATYGAIANLVVGAAPGCVGYYYVSLAGNRYFIGTILENSGTGKGFWFNAAIPAAGAAATAVTAVAAGGTATNVYGILQ